MKALLIILALVAASFIGLLVYGNSRSEEPKRECARIPKPPPGQKKPTSGQMENWCPPGIVEKTKGLQARFAPGLGEGKRIVEVGAAGASLTVPPKPDEKVRAAKLTLKSGNFAIARGPEDAVVCLCRAKAPIPANLRDQCDAPWRRKHANRSACLAKFDRGTIPFREPGGTLLFPTNQQSAKVQVE